MKLKSIVIFTVVLASLTFSGCVPGPVEAVSINKNQLSNAGEVVGILPSGQEVLRWSVWSPDGNRVHYVYVVQGVTTVSTNHLGQTGKTNTNRTDVVVINGKEYVPVK